MWCAESRGIPNERLPHGCSTVIEVRGKCILRVVMPHYGHEDIPRVQLVVVAQPCSVASEWRYQGRLASARGPSFWGTCEGVVRDCRPPNGLFLGVGIVEKAQLSRNSSSSECASCRKSAHFLSCSSRCFSLPANYLDVKPLVQKEIDVLVPDPHARTNAINFLLAAVCVVQIPTYLC